MGLVEILTFNETQMTLEIVDWVGQTVYTLNSPSPVTGCLGETGPCVQVERSELDSRQGQCRMTSRVVTKRKGPLEEGRLITYRTLHVLSSSTKNRFTKLLKREPNYGMKP